jgi:hypothetical protein
MHGRYNIKFRRGYKNQTVNTVLRNNRCFYVMHTQHTNALSKNNVKTFNVKLGPSYSKLKVVVNRNLLISVYDHRGGL